MTPILLKNVTIWPGYGEATQSNMSVLIEKGRISEIAPTDVMQSPPDAKTVDCDGATAIPVSVSVSGPNHRPTYHGSAAINRRAAARADDNAATAHDCLNFDDIADRRLDLRSKRGAWRRIQCR